MSLEYTDAPGVPPTSFEVDFLPHRRLSEWWYVTGHVRADDGREFAFQFTLCHMMLRIFPFHLFMTSLTDLQSGEHYYGQELIFFNKGITCDATQVAVAEKAQMTFAPNEHGSHGHMTLSQDGNGYGLEVSLDATKPPVWHCNDGVLIMGQPANLKARTYYFSYTNLDVSGTLSLGGERIQVTGRAWFDRQGGPYDPFVRRSHWEWFSLRMNDNTEIMLFAFPHVEYFDGTAIDAQGNYRRLRDYTLEATETRTISGNEFSTAWDVEIEGTPYQITPRVDGMFNHSYFEVLCDVRTPDGEVVGTAFGEILPGVRGSVNPLKGLVSR